MTSEPNDGSGNRPHRSVINSAAYSNGVRVADIPIADLGDAWKHSDRFLWVGLHEPTEKVLLHIQQAFGLHDLAVEDAHNAHQRPKLEVYDDCVFVIIRTVKLSDRENQRIEFGETHVFLGPRYVVTVRHGSPHSHVGVRARCESTPNLLAKGEGFVLHAVMDFIVDQYFPVIDALEAELDELEVQIFSGKLMRSVTARIYHLRRDLLAIKQAISPLIEVSSRLARSNSQLISDDARPYFQDVHDHVVRIADLIDSLQQLSQTALESNLALISVGQNDDTKRLAAWAAMLAVPTMIAGLYGMNFKYMPETQWVWGYPVSLGIMLVSCLILYQWFRKLGWL
ncbi:Magnesium transport protein CorA [Rubripirellula lacrimiformis]|uniref:Magnesium transport protein CorA n=1 Tax=Rubripirellula lacrimiformis TaxID=1930273 RepID=A0A517NJQ6_9BACT|nr:magnesium/cobalt transporter CorA [Rubripirellula lacrimiformis]QDT07359.1 Magnesium transport protein CorA [Rubripirellula lacrimiformis]